MKDGRFPNDKYIYVMSGFSQKKLSRELESTHLISIHKWSDIEVRVMQAARAET
jgi:hypothetical protein